MKLSDIIDGAKEIEIKGITADSREVNQGFVFGSLNDDSYIEDAVKKGAVAIITRQDYEKDFAGVTMIKTENPTNTYAKAVAKYYGAQPSHIAAITGTNGKTSVTEISTQLLRNSGQEVLSVGNNGTVLSDVVANGGLSPKGIYVCEVSSFQAQCLKFLHPTYTLWTNFAPDHLNWHGGVKNYFFAKYNLLKRTKKACFCGNSLKKTFQSFEIQSPAASVVFAPPAKELNDWLAQFPLCFSQGQRENFALIRTLAQQFGIDATTLRRTLEAFQQPPHRLHCCRRIGETTFWNDSKGTNLHAVQAALESLKNLPNLWWILGGGGKGENLDGFIQTLNRYPVQTVCLIGETGRELMQKASEFKANVIHAETLPNVFKHLPTNQTFTLVLSPGFTSWDQFKSFEERGELFEKLVWDYVPSSRG